MKKIKISMPNYTGHFAGVNFVNSEAEVEEIPPRLERICRVSGYKLEELKPKTKRTRKKKA